MEDLYRILGSVPDAMIAVDKDGMVVAHNDDAAIMFGYVHEAMNNINVEQLMPSMYRDRHRGHRSSYFKTPTRRHMGAGFEIVGLHASGSTFKADVSLNPYQSDSSGLLILAAVRNRTARIQEHNLGASRVRRFISVRQPGSPVLFVTCLAAIFIISYFTANNVVTNARNNCYHGSADSASYINSFRVIADGFDVIANADTQTAADKTQTPDTRAIRGAEAARLDADGVHLAGSIREIDTHVDQKEIALLKNASDAAWARAAGFSCSAANPEPSLFP
jgi:PAS domain S-box-containing protein